MEVNGGLLLKENYIFLENFLFILTPNHCIVHCGVIKNEVSAFLCRFYSVLCKMYSLLGIVHCVK